MWDYLKNITEICTFLKPLFQFRLNDSKRRTANQDQQGAEILSAKVWYLMDLQNLRRG